MGKGPAPTRQRISFIPLAVPTVRIRPRGPGARGSCKCPLNSSRADSTRVPSPPAACVSFAVATCSSPQHWSPFCCRYLLTHRFFRGVPLRAALWQLWSVRCRWFLFPYGFPPRSPFSPWPPGPCTSQLGQHPGFVTRPDRLVAHPYFDYFVREADLG